MADKEFYTIQEIADILGLHVKTVRNYVRQGRIVSTKVGKQYRVPRQDLEAFIGKTLESGPEQKPPMRPEVSSIVEIDGVNIEKAGRISGMITAAAKGHQDGMLLRVNVLHDPERERLKIIILGSIEATTIMLELVRHYTER